MTLPGGHRTGGQIANGVERPIVSSGQRFGRYCVHSAALMMFRLRQRGSERYGAELKLKPGAYLHEKIRREVSTMSKPRRSTSST